MKPKFLRTTGYCYQSKFQWLALLVKCCSTVQDWSQLLGEKLENRILSIFARLNQTSWWTDSYLFNITFSTSSIIVIIKQIPFCRASFNNFVPGKIFTWQILWTDKSKISCLAVFSRGTNLRFSKTICCISFINVSIDNLSTFNLEINFKCCIWFFAAQT